jgi:hypothetical protein
MTEKRFSANINVWCRCPGILIAPMLGYIGIMKGHCAVPMIAMSMQLILPPYNALYYCKQSIANYSVHFMLELLGLDHEVKQRISVTLGGQVMEWEEALQELIPKGSLQEPQRGS